MRLLLAAPPLHGHVGPLLLVGRELASRGHDVTVLTGAEFARAAGAAGLRWRGLPGAAVARSFGRGPRRRLRVVQGRDEILETFVRPLAAQHRALTTVLGESAWDAVVCDTAFLGALPLLLTEDRRRRPPVLGVSATPLSIVSVDCAPFGPGLQPGRTAVSRLRNRHMDWVLRTGPLRPVHRELDAVLSGYGVPPGSLDFFDHAGRFDLTFQLAPPEIEYPRRELPDSIRFVGPLAPDLGSGPTPPWWGDLDGRPVVHVTQGTLHNEDPGQLIVPTIRALADEPVLTVVATGGPAPSSVAAAMGPLPDNVRVERYLPYGRLLPRTDVVVSNGGYGGVQQALRHGVPLVIAGDTADKPEVAARVRRVGAGLDLRTGQPSPRRVRRAVRSVLADPSYRRNAARMRRSIERLGDPCPVIADAVETLGRDLGRSARAASTAG